MTALAEFSMDGGGSVLIAVNEPADSQGAAVFRGGVSRDLVERSSISMQAALARVRPAIDAVLESFTGLQHRPDELTVTFGVEFSAEAGAIIAAAAAKANFGVTVTWKARPAGGEPSMP